MQAWRRDEAELAFRWGTHGSGANGAAARLRPQFIGREVTDPVSGETVLAEPLKTRVQRYIISIVVTNLCLLVPLGVMLALLNLQGYVGEDAAHAVLGVDVYMPRLAEYAKPGT